MDFFKKYTIVFLLSYLLIILTKFIFIFYLQNMYSEFELQTLIYAIFWGYKFDFAAGAIVAFLATLFNFNKNIFKILTSFLLINLFFIQIGDILYFNESSRHIGYEISDSFVDGYSLFMTAISQHTVITILSIVFGVLLYLITFKYFNYLNAIKLNKLYILKQLFAILLTIFFIRGMFQHIPLNPWQSNQIGDSKLATLSLNAAYNVLYAIANKKKNLQASRLITPSYEEMSKAMQSIYPKGTKRENLPLIDTKPNIVFLFLESWSAKNLKPYGFRYNTTPFFNAILEKSLRPRMMIAGGHRTTEGMFCVLTSYQNPLGKSVAKTQLQSFQYTSFVDILNKDGYSSSFFQGTAKETSGTGSFAQSLGFQHSYGKADVIKRVYEENNWGVHDNDLYTFTQEKIANTLSEPFVIGINGATTHDDKIPNGIKLINYVKDKNLNARLNALHFSDQALEKFVQNIEKKYPNTIFVFFADHCGGGITDSMQNYMIPFALYSKKLIKPKYIDEIISQRDIAPTLYDMIIGDYRYSNNSFSGKSLVSDTKFYNDYFHNGVLGWIENNSLIEINTITNKMKCFEIDSFKRKSTQCTLENKEAKKRAISFTALSQKFLFEDKIDNLKSLMYK